ncbi:fatty acid desaturase [Zavarzinia sp.]|uniref:fatty acid desaturase n=1 Tax=Zavarzinia sp. TaxID=2027920 RepID=UPI0035623FFA
MIVRAENKNPGEPVVAAEAGNGRVRAILIDYQRPVVWRSLTQLAISLALFLAFEVALYATFGISYWLTLALAVPAAAMVVKLFIIQHDCGHGAFMPSARGNDLIGHLCSLATFTPYLHWRRQHAGHHAVWNDLDRRDSGVDLYSVCITLDEYQALSPWGRRRYRLMQHPLLALVLLPPLIFLVVYRFAFDTPASWWRERRSVHLTNAALLLLYGGLGLVFGFGTVAAVQLPVIAMAALVGVWLFSSQHRFEHVVWRRHADWDATTAALRGSSFLKLPRFFDWVTGHIGFHHIHHLSARVPNYRLRAAHEALAPVTELAPPLGFLRSLGASRFAVWDEANGRMIRFPH